MGAKKCVMFLTVVSCAFVCLGNPRCQLQENAPWPMFHHDLRHSGLSDYAGPSDPVLLWSYPTEWWEGGSNGPVLGGHGVVYDGSNDIFALMSNGSLSWSYDINAVWPSLTLGSNGVIYGGAYDYGFYALNSNGSLVWSYKTPLGTGSSFAIGSGGKLFAGSNNGNYRIFCFGLDGALVWSYLTGAAVNSSPVIGDNGVVFIGSNDYRLYAMDPNGSLIWSYRSGGRMYSSPAFGKNDEIHIGTADDRSVYTFSSTGSLLWSYRTVDHVISSPAVDSSWRIYVGSNDRNMYALNSSGSLAWSYTADGAVQSSAALGSDGMIYFCSNYSGKRAYALDSDGSLCWERILGGGGSSPAIGSDGRLYIKSQPNDDNDGAIFCIGQAPTSSPTPTGPTPTPTETPTKTPTPTITATPTPVPWWDSRWNMRKRIAIGNAGSSALTDFPACIIVSREDGMQNDYDDLRFISHGSELDYEIDNYNESTATVWVKIPEIPASGTFMYMYYGNAAAGSGQDPTGVWSNGYAGVWHLGEANGNISDSSGNGKTGSVNGEVNYHQAGKIGCAVANPDTGHFVVGDDSFGEIGNFTVEAWFRYTTDGMGGLLTRHGEWGPGSWIYGLRNGKATFGRSEQFIDSNKSVNDGKWHYIVGVLIPGSRQYIYIDGTQDKDGAVDSVTDTGHDMIFFDESNGLWKLRGCADEVRISTTARSIDWIKQSYQMVVNQATYVTFSGEEPVPTPTPTNTPTTTPTETPTITPTGTPTNTPTQAPTKTPTATPTQSPASPPMIGLAPIKTVVGTGDTFALELDIGTRIAGMGTLVGYLVVQTPEGAWFSLVPNERGGFDMKRGIKPAMNGTVIPALHIAIISQKIADSLARGDYLFAAAIFNAGDRPTLENWRALAIYSSEATITLR